MARTSEGAALTRSHRRQQTALRAATLRDLMTLWRTVDPTDLSATIGRFAAAAAVLVRARHRDSAGLAARYFTAFRTAEGIGGRADVRLAEQLAAEAAVEALRGAALSGIIKARRAGFSPQAAAQNGLVKTSGQAASLVLNGSRETVIGSAARDSRAERWQRVTSDSPCAFCAMLASRGAVFRAEASADFEAHDHCSCSVEVAYEGSQPPESSRRWAEQWKAAQRDARAAGELKRGTGNDALNAFRRARG